MSRLFKHISGRVVLALLAVQCFVSQSWLQAAPLSPPRDWKTNPPIALVQTTETIYAIGDIHGDYERMADLLTSARLIEGRPAQPAAVKWTGGKSVLIVVGDFIDKYNRSLDVIATLRILQTEAHDAGGQVIVTMGNHEAEFLAAAGSTKKKSAAEFVTELKTAGLSQKDVAAGTDANGVGQFLRNLPIAAQVNDWFFCHAGNTHGLTQAQLADQLIGGIDKEGFATPILSDPDSILEARMHPHPWWEPADSSSKDSSAPLRANLKALGVKHLVIGHQPGAAVFSDGSHRAKDQMFAHFDGLFFMIDTGMSRGADGGRGAVLKIEPPAPGATRGAAAAIYQDGSTEELLKAK